MLTEIGEMLEILCNSNVENITAKKPDDFVIATGKKL